MGSPASPEDPGRRSPRQAAVALAVALSLGAVMNAESLADVAERQPFGWQRTVAVWAVAPVETLGELTRLDRLNAWLSETVGAWLRQDPGRGPDAVTEAPTPTPAPDEPPEAEPTAEPTPTPEPTPVPEDPEPTPTPAVERRVPDEDAPLRVWLTGDSLVEALGAPLDAALSAEVPTEVRTDPNYATGLARPDYFDWHAYAAEELEAGSFDLAVVMMGGNDAQDMRDADGEVIRIDQEAWDEEYHDRVAALLDLLLDGVADVYWIGLPVMQDDGLDERMRRIDARYREAVEAEPRAHYVETRELFSDDGAYTSYLPSPDGGVDRVRRDDGIHLSLEGGRLLVEDRLAEAVLEHWSRQH